MCCLNVNATGAFGDRGRPGLRGPVDHQRRRQGERAVREMGGARVRQRRVAGRGGDGRGGGRGVVAIGARDDGPNVAAGPSVTERGAGTLPPSSPFAGTLTEMGSVSMFAQPWPCATYLGTLE